MRRATLFCWTTLLLTGCVERKLTITSEPSGALVYMNDKEVGRTPIETDFTWYGDYDVQVRLPGYLTIDRAEPVKSPWWQIPPIDLFAELAPWHPTNRKHLNYVMTPRPPDDSPPEELVSRSFDLKAQLESPDRPTTGPTTAPATQPTRP